MGGKKAPKTSVGALCLMALFVPGCGEPGTTAASDRSVRDSAGVTIYEFRISEAVAPGPAALDPTLRIGAAEGADPYLFSYITAVATSPEGEIAVADYMGKEIRIFGPDGTHRVTFGRDGDGPAEFRWPAFIEWGSGDTLIAFDFSLQRFTIFTDQGSLVEARRVPQVDTLTTHFVEGLLGSAQAISWTFFRTNLQEGVFRPPIILTRMDLKSQTLEAIAAGRGSERPSIRTARGLESATKPFSATSDVAVGDEAIYLLDARDSRSIKVFRPDGGLRSILRVVNAMPEVDDELLGRWKEAFLRVQSRGDPDVRADMERRLTHFPPPERLPVFRSLEAMTDGGVCAERYPITDDAGSVYWCFDREGEFAGRFSLPEGLVRYGGPDRDPHYEVGPDYFLGVWADEMGVQQVRMYSIQLQPPQPS